MDKIIQAMDTPESPYASLCKALTSSPWWKTILIVIILIVLFCFFCLFFFFLLFAPCICSCVAIFVSNHWKDFKLQIVVQAPTITTASFNYYLGPLIRDPQYKGKQNMFPQQFRVCAPQQLQNENSAPFTGNVILLKEKGENES